MIPRSVVNINRYWADLMVAELVRCGITFFCLAPGSRSTPLVQAIAAHPEAQHVIHYDERGTAFCALGYGRATGKPAAWITTSGTALANGFPAIIEASVDAVPMLLLTADRPPELRQTGANQTIDQVKLFGDYPRWFFDVPVPTLEVDPSVVLTTVDQAVYRAMHSPAGPVHLNCMFREPLASSSSQAVSSESVRMQRWRASGQPFTGYRGGRAPLDTAAIDGLLDHLLRAERGLIIAGNLGSAVEGRAVQALAERLRWPLLADVGSHLRLGEGASEVLIANFDMLLADERFGTAHCPEVIVQFGGRVTSKRLARYFKDSAPATHIVVKEDPARFDPDHQVTHRYEAEIAAVCTVLVGRLACGADSDWLVSWQRRSAQVDKVLDTHFLQQSQLTEPLLARLITRHLPANHALVLSSSMPVREVDSFGVVDGETAFVAANRGASGIDGLVATAVGVAAGRPGGTTLLIGDLALLHDLNSLALLQQHPVVVVVVNNNGGGIFHFLPIAKQVDVFEPFFGTPHGLQFEAAATLFGIDYVHPKSATAFVKTYQHACQEGISVIIEIQTDRSENAALHQQLLQSVREAFS